MGFELALRIGDRNTGKSESSSPSPTCHSSLLKPTRNPSSYVFVSLLNRYPPKVFAEIDELFLLFQIGREELALAARELCKSLR